MGLINLLSGVKYYPHHITFSAELEAELFDLKFIESSLYITGGIKKRKTINLSIDGRAIDLFIGLRLVKQVGSGYVDVGMSIARSHYSEVKYFSDGRFADDIRFFNRDFDAYLGYRYFIPGSSLFLRGNIGTRGIGAGIGVNLVK